MRPYFLLLALAGCGNAGLSDGTYNTTFVNQNMGCSDCPDLEGGGTSTWTVSGGGATLNTGKEAVTLTPDATQTGWSQDLSQTANGCTADLHLVTTLTVSDSPIQGTAEITLTGCETCSCVYKVTMVKQ